MSIAMELVPRRRDMLPVPPTIPHPPQPLLVLLPLPFDLAPFQSSSLSEIPLLLPALPLDICTLLSRSLTGDASVPLLEPSALIRLLPLLCFTAKTLYLPALFLLGKKCRYSSLNTLLLLLSLPLFLYSPLMNSNALPPRRLREMLLLFLLTARLTVLLQTDALPSFISEDLALELLLATIVLVAGRGGGFLPCLFGPVGQAQVDMITATDAWFPAARLYTDMESAEGVFVSCLVLAFFLSAAVLNTVRR